MAMAKRRRGQILPLLALAASLASPADSWSLEGALADWIKSSEPLADLHRRHVSSDRARHMMQSTPLARAPDDAKVAFARGPLGRIVAGAMAREQALLGDWKIEKIVEAAGEDFDGAACHRRLLDVLDRAPVTLFSFVDCPWCLLARRLLEDDCGLNGGDGGPLRVVELEDLGWEGKRLRAAVALATGRTSMPACFIGRRSLGGYTDGFVEDGVDERSSGFVYVPPPDRDLRYARSRGLAKLHVSGELATLLREVL